MPQWPTSTSNKLDICCQLISEADRLNRIQKLLQNPDHDLEVLWEIYTIQKNLAAIKLALLRYEMESNLTNFDPTLIKKEQMEELQQLVTMFLSPQK